MFKRRSITAIAVAALVVGCAPLAHADPVSDYTSLNAGRVCKTLDTYPTFAGVTGTITAIIQDGKFTVTQAVQVLVYSVETQCDRHLPLLNRYASQDGGGRQV